MAGLNPFHHVERTTFATPTRRMEAALATAGQADGTDSPEQQELVRGLAQQLLTEPDPLVRGSILKACGKFQSPLATESLLAGLSDQDPHVRKMCCKQLASRPSDQVAKALANSARADDAFDVRVAATQALGTSGENSAQHALVVALEDRNPALQMVGVEAMRNLTGQDHGRNVAAYAAIAKGETPAEAAPPRETAVANRSGWFSFF